MFHFFKKLADTVANAKPNKLRLFADENELFKTKNSLGVVRTLGNAVRSIEYLSTDGLVDTYLVKTDDFEFELTVTNGRGIESIEAPVGAGEPGALDEYTVVYNDGTEGMLLVRNGTNGTNGDNGAGVPTLVVAQSVGNESSAGTAGPEYANPDHVHAHGNQSNPNHHAVATPSDAGFMSGADKTKLDAVAAGATRVLVDAVPTDGSNNAVTSNGVFDALALKLNAAEKGAANGITPLGADQKVPAIFLPAFVDDVLEFPNLAAFPAVGESGKIYVAVNGANAANPSKQYRWSGTTYTEISPSPGSTDAVPEGASNLYFTAQRVRETVLTGLSLVAGTAITAADTVLSALGMLQKQVTDGVAALAAHVNNTSNPHNTTAAQVGADPAGTASQAITAHLADPAAHSQYLTQEEALALIPPNKLSARISTLFASPANSTAVTIVLSLAIPAGYLTQGKSFDFDLEGTQSQSAAATNVVGSIFVNNTQLVTQAVAGGTAAQTNRSLRMKGGIMWNGSNYLGNITVGISGILPLGNANVTGVPVAAGTAHTIDIRVQTSTANAANIIRAMVAAIKEI